MKLKPTGGRKQGQETETKVSVFMKDAFVLQRIKKTVTEKTVVLYFIK